MTTSRQVAEVFGKRHDNVLRAIKELECSPEFKALNFELVEITQKNALGAKFDRSYYVITRDGFTFLCMGFTGKKAAQFKETYIAEFNSKPNKVYLEFIEAMTGYRAAAVYNFLRAHEAMGNLEDFTQLCKRLPDAESVIRPLATKSLNADPERQAAIWEQVVEQAGDKEITAKMVKDAIRKKATFHERR